MVVIQNRPPFNTPKLMTDRQMATYQAIASRLDNGISNPKLILADHIAQDADEQTLKSFSTLEAYSSTLDGITFKANDPTTLERAFRQLKSSSGETLLVSMREDPDHWALKASFGKTDGIGWREPWRPNPFSLPGPDTADAGRRSPLSMRFGTTGSRMRFTALHCAINKISGKCNIHIDESGFVLAMPGGISLTADLYDHVMNELLLKTDFRDWLVGKTSNETVKAIIKDVIGRITLHYPNAANGYGGVRTRIKSLQPMNSPERVVKNAWRIARPSGVSFDVFASERLKVQVTGTMSGGENSATVTIGGTF
jgi:hypothetical protein